MYEIKSCVTGYKNICNVKCGDNLLKNANACSKYCVVEQHIAGAEVEDGDWCPGMRRQSAAVRSGANIRSDPALQLSIMSNIQLST